MSTVRKSVLDMFRKYNISLEQWSKGKAKTLDHLIGEIESGEAKLSEIDGKLTRTATGSTINIFHCSGKNRQVLTEEKQVFTDGRERIRNLDPEIGFIGEKLKLNESPLEGAKRALEEELGISKKDVEKCDLIFCECRKKGPVTSDSYPGLMTIYIVHLFTLDLPNSLYKPEGYKEFQKDKTNYYIWEKVG